MDETRLRAFFDFDDLRTEIVEGDVERVVYTGEKLQVMEYRFPAHKTFAAHKHDENEQMGYVVRGTMGFMVGDEERTLGPGDFYHARIGEVHSAWTFDEPAVLIDVFAPPRDDILEYSNDWVEVPDGQDKA